ncbi:hypothetical protein M2282_001595 [Variovorax boronicumulans]|uniref:hypothetical protein n=1 Tax=Variovorax boronicumulans TaxID=436515 RepID=UPI002474D5B4|nr:hypothetical protein [Variovorax boronicumulans]MDH6166448.1 hypothetical protein [Variovorax boronicumulans]
MQIMRWMEITVAVLGVAVLMVSTFGSSRVFRAGSATKQAHVWEEEEWEALRHDGARATAQILALARPGFRLVTWRGDSPNMAAAELLIAFTDSDGENHRVTLRTFIDQELLANFSGGRPLPIVYAKDPTLRVAVDRDRTQLEIPSTIDA